MINVSAPQTPDTGTLIFDPAIDGKGTTVKVRVTSETPAEVRVERMHKSDTWIPLSQGDPEWFRYHHANVGVGKIYARGVGGEATLDAYIVAATSPEAFGG